jgi:copper(I)-binding protein
MFRLPTLAVAVLALAAPAAARPNVTPVEVIQPWSRPAVAGSTAVGYLTLVNHGRNPVALVGAQSPLARKAEIHRSSMAGGVMRMAPQASVAIPPGGAVRFAPGGYHLMFLGLSKPLSPGDRLPATLRFSDGRQVRVAFQVGSGAEPAPMAQLKHQVRPTSAK